MPKVRIFRDKLKNGKLCRFYSYDFTIRGKRFCKSTGLENKAHAQKLAQGLFDRLNLSSTADSTIEYINRVLKDGKKIRLKKVIDAYLNIPIKGTRSDLRIRSIRSRWNDFTAYLNKYNTEIKHLSQISHEHSKKYISTLQKSGRYLDSNSTRLAVETTNRFIKDFRSVFSKLKEEAGLIDNPFKEKWTPTKFKDVISREVFTIEELNVIGSGSNMFVYHIFMIGMNTGFREGDICTLRWSEIDFDSNQINRVMLKTGKEVHPPVLLHLYKYLRKIQKYTGNKEYVSPVHAEIYNHNQSTISERVKSELKRLGIQTQIQVKNRTRNQSVKNVHSLRHAFCYYAMLEGVEINIVQSIIGHIDEQMTVMYANHAFKILIQDRVKNFPDYLNQNNQLRLIDVDDYTSDRYYDRKISNKVNDISIDFVDVPDGVDVGSSEDLKENLDVVNDRSFEIINTLLEKDLIDQEEHKTFTMMAEILFNQLDSIITTEQDQEEA